MAAGAEVSGAVILNVESPAALYDKSIEKSENSNSKKSGESDLTDGVKDSDLNSNADLKSELQIKDFVDMLKELKLNPQVKEFIPSSYCQGQMGAYNFVPFSTNLRNDGFPNHRRGSNNHNHGRKRMTGRAFRAQREDSVRRTDYVSDIDHNITKEQLAALFSGYGESEDEREMCSRTVYYTNIDKKVSQDDVKNLFEAKYGEVSCLRLLGDQMQSTRITFVEFFMAESAIVALDHCGEILGSQHIWVSPSKTPVRPQVPHPGMQ